MQRVHTPRGYGDDDDDRKADDRDAEPRRRTKRRTSLQDRLWTAAALAGVAVSVCFLFLVGCRLWLPQAPRSPVHAAPSNRLLGTGTYFAGHKVLVAEVLPTGDILYNSPVAWRVGDAFINNTTPNVYDLAPLLKTIQHTGQSLTQSQVLGALGGAQGQDSKQEYATDPAQAASPTQSTDPQRADADPPVSTAGIFSRGGKRSGNTFVPATLKQRYGYPTSATAGTGVTIAVVAAFDNPTIEADLAVFSSAMNLPGCTSASGCFRKVNQNGGTSYPAVNGGWALEIALDVQWAHAVAPGAHILLVEAATNSYSDLLAAVAYAHTHADVVSMSWGGPEVALDNPFNRECVTYLAASGDDGTVIWPSSSPHVVSVGGTSISSGADVGWSGSGGGCSSVYARTDQQAGAQGFSATGCGARRATPDIAMFADPSPGYAVFLGASYSGYSGWVAVGGTSASTPVIAGLLAATGSAVLNQQSVYGQGRTYSDVTSGSTQYNPCRPGYDLVTGLGVPHVN